MMLVFELIDLQDILIDGLGMIPDLSNPLDPRLVDDPSPHQTEYILPCYYDLLNMMLFFSIDIPGDLPHQSIGFVFPFTPEVKHV